MPTRLKNTRTYCLTCGKVIKNPMDNQQFCVNKQKCKNSYNYAKLRKYAEAWKKTQSLINDESLSDQQVYNRIGKLSEEYPVEA